MDLSRVRNFCIIAHIDHGKTTLSDRLLEATETVSEREMHEQLLDSMDLERERGITIKSHPVTLKYRAADGGDYSFNLIDTPGHVDFSYEVSRSLAACEGALLLVDAAQGIEAQTVANAHLAVEQGMHVIPVVNKIDLPGADIELIHHQLEDILAIPADEAIHASAKDGKGIPEIIDAIIERVPPPRWSEYPQTRTLIFDCIYDSYKGVICYVRVFSGSLRRGDKITFMSDGSLAEIKEVGFFSPGMKPLDELGAGFVGYLVTNIKEVSEVTIGDTITRTSQPAEDMLPGYQEVRPMVFSGLYPIDTSDYEKLKKSMGKLRLNDAAFVYTPEVSAALGFGFRCGFLGLLHMEIITERIRREYDLDILSTYPSVVYKVVKSDGEEIEVHNPMNLPDPSEIEQVYEPTIIATLHVPSSSIGDILALVTEKRGYVDHTETLDSTRVMMNAHLPLNEILVDFNDRLKSITRGYGSMDYEIADFQKSELVRLDILVNGEPVDAFSSIVHKDKAEGKGRMLCGKLREILPRQMFKIAIQATVGGHVVARESLEPCART